MLVFNCVLYCFQDLYENFDDVVVATGSGGTISGLAVANYLTGSRIR